MQKRKSMPNTPDCPEDQVVKCNNHMLRLKDLAGEPSAAAETCADLQWDKKWIVKPQNTMTTR